MMERDANVNLNSNFFVTSLFVIYILSIYTEVKSKKDCRAIDVWREEVPAILVSGKLSLLSLVGLEFCKIQLSVFLFGRLFFLRYVGHFLLADENNFVAVSLNLQDICDAIYI